MKRDAFLKSESARALYDACKDLPIIDYHNHLSPADLLGCVRWLLDGSASAFVTGIIVPVDGGFLTLGGV